MQVFEGQDRIAYVGETTTYKVAKGERGLRANEIERRLADKFGQFLVPTTGCLCMNIQPTVPIVELDLDTIWSCIPRVIQARYSGSLAHSLERIGNLGVHEGQVKFTDAGSSALERIMWNHAEYLAEGLNSIRELYHQ